MGIGCGRADSGLNPVRSKYKSILIYHWLDTKNTNTKKKMPGMPQSKSLMTTLMK